MPPAVPARAGAPARASGPAAQRPAVPARPAGPSGGTARPAAGATRVAAAPAGAVRTAAPAPPVRAAAPAAPVRAAAPPRPVPVPVGVPARPAPAPGGARAVEPAPRTRVRLPVPPSPAAAPAPAPVAAPRTTVAPFQAVPTPDHGDEPPAAAPPLTPRRRAADRVHPVPAAPAPVDEPARSAAPSPAAAPVHGAAPGYGDWTNPSRTRDEAAAPATTAIPDRAAPARAAAPATEAIPDRAPARHDDAPYAAGAPSTGEDRYADEDVYGPDDRDGEDARGPDTGSSTGVVGGRAAFRAERQAAEAERLRVMREEAGRGPGVRRAAVGLLAVAVVALVVLGVYSFTSPQVRDAAGSTPSAPVPTSAAPAVPSSVLPPLDVGPLPPADAAPVAPVRLPVTVLNATGVSGLAGDVSAELVSGGWEAGPIGEYEGADIATTTVYYTQGDQAQYDAAVQLTQQYAQITGPAVRFFEVPDVDDPGLVVVTTGEWLP
ncbi:LytR cell envelope-related transcriptional attenuator [Geodermatophilus pulveris]|uniref:LytR cell envelope-related transcriptional attenuator n=1 Tax=Geodermatophilus pulveris TaxID=1564159 RepID=A0A239H6Y4_9ACTN|nr:LytR cell envelope-related transcriptional attenuator [Geodermatophilus pulveris]